MNWKFLLFNPAGVIALQEKNVILLELLCMAVLAIPFFIILISIVRKYRAEKNSTYEPELSGNTTKQILLWIPAALLVMVLSVIIWRSTYAVDPFKAIDSPNPPLTIEVVALQWKWLFIYPQENNENIATVNFVEVPENTPLHFVLTADAPINSFWIPELGGQMYAMSGMTTNLNLMANKTGEFRGGAAEISGAGFAGMNFIAKSVSKDDFDSWIQSVGEGQTILTQEEYDTLAKTSMDNKPDFYASVEPGLFDSIVGKYTYMNEGMGKRNINSH